MLNALEVGDDAVAPSQTIVEVDYVGRPVEEGHGGAAFTETKCPTAESRSRIFQAVAGDDDEDESESDDTDDADEEERVLNVPETDEEFEEFERRLREEFEEDPE